MTIRHVYQPDDTGCGIAVLAMILGTTYGQVKNWMIEENIFEPNTEYWGTNFNDLITFLNKKNIRTERKRKFKKWKNIPAKIAIASTNYDKTGQWHWVLFIRDIQGCYIYDPGKRRKKIRDLRGKRTGAFIEVHDVKM
jgi:hypothetical protein